MSLPRRPFFLSVLLAATLTAAVGRALPAAAPPRVDPEMEVFAEALGDSPRGNQRYHVIHMEFKDRAAREHFKSDKLMVFTAIDRFATAFLDTAQAPKAVAALKEEPDLVWAELGGLVVAPPPPPVGFARERGRAFEEIVRGGIDGLTGKGVVIAVIDTGIDFRNKDFLRPDGTSRLLWYWDVVGDDFAKGRGGQKPPVSYPNGAPVGTLYSREDLNRALKDNTVLAEPDDDGHGTACAAVAAGNGGHSGESYRGVAPAADLVAVRLGTRKGMTHGFMLLAVCEWLEKTFGGSESKPLVLSCSFGGHSGCHDASGIEDRALDARFPKDSVGRAICIAAGNEGNKRIHAAANLTAARQTQSFQWARRPRTTGGGKSILLVIADGADPDDLQWGRNEKIQLLHAPFVHPISRAVVARLVVPPEGELKITSKGEKAVRVDAYLQGASGAVRFGEDCASTSGTVSHPGVASNVITVGSYDFNDLLVAGRDAYRIPVADADGKQVALEPGALSDYSSRGPTRAGRRKPDVVAPGRYHIVPAVKATPASARPPGSDLTLHDGTSAATPYVAGVVALMLERQPKLTLGRIKELLQENASRNPPPQNDDWGSGKLNRAAVKRVVDKLKVGE